MRKRLRMGKKERKKERTELCDGRIRYPKKYRMWPQMVKLGLQILISFKNLTA